MKKTIAFTILYSLCHNQVLATDIGFDKAFLGTPSSALSEPVTSFSYKDHKQALFALGKRCFQGDMGDVPEEEVHESLEAFLGQHTLDTKDIEDAYEDYQTDNSPASLIISYEVHHERHVLDALEDQGYMSIALGHMLKRHLMKTMPLSSSNLFQEQEHHFSQYAPMMLHGYTCLMDLYGGKKPYTVMRLDQEGVKEVKPFQESHSIPKSQEKIIALAEQVMKYAQDDLGKRWQAMGLACVLKYQGHQEEHLDVITSETEKYVVSLSQEIARTSFQNDEDVKTFYQDHISLFIHYIITGPLYGGVASLQTPKAIIQDTLQAKKYMSLLSVDLFRKRYPDMPLQELSTKVQAFLEDQWLWTAIKDSFEMNEEGCYQPIMSRDTLWQELFFNRMDEIKAYVDS